MAVVAAVVGWGSFVGPTRILNCRLLVIGSHIGGLRLGFEVMKPLLRRNLEALGESEEL